MIVSHRHRFIFMKTKKTAGSSLEVALAPVCGPEDVITPLLPAEEALRPERGAQNWERRSLGPTALRFVRQRMLGQRASKTHYFSHIEAWRARRYLGRRIWDSYFKFCIERNPWDRQVSYYWFRKSKGGNPDLTFEAFLDDPAARLRNWPIYTLDDRVAVDFVIRYERLADDLKSVLDHLGIREPVVLPQAKSGYRRDRAPYADYYDDATRERVAGWYAREIREFDYRFERDLPGRHRSLDAALPRGETGRD